MGINPSHFEWKHYEINAGTTGLFACPLARWLAPLTQSLALPCLLRFRAPLRSFVRSLAHSVAPKPMEKRLLYDLCASISWFSLVDQYEFKDEVLATGSSASTGKKY